MKQRWRFLFWISLATLIGVAWLFQRLGASLWAWMNVQLIGMVLGSGLAFIAMVTSARSRAFAWIALVCWLPMAYDLGGAFGHIVEFTRELGPPAALFLIGGLLTSIVALWIALAPAPREPEEPIAQARVR